MDALDVVMAGNSCGDIVAALQSLPGTQKVGEDGKLYVRGGESEECQTFINGMHVLVPYSTNAENTAVRGRFSPFLFKGICFSLGGYGGEYGQALSSFSSLPFCPPKIICITLFHTIQYFSCKIKKLIMYLI